VRVTLEQRDCHPDCIAFSSSNLLMTRSLHEKRAQVTVLRWCGVSPQVGRRLWSTGR